MQSKTFKQIRVTFSGYQWSSYRSLPDLIWFWSALHSDEVARRAAEASGFRFIRAPTFDWDSVVASYLEAWRA